MDCILRYITTYLFQLMSCHHSPMFYSNTISNIRKNCCLVTDKAKCIKLLIGTTHFDGNLTLDIKRVLDVLSYNDVTAPGRIIKLYKIFFSLAALLVQFKVGI